ncbi:hypothetical protein FACS189449_02050 [Alphaproteobacteria bacterium]|nr:hypothetical protein FACS189449_02050 [Alphaproteobacteria bacterium]
MTKILCYEKSKNGIYLKVKVVPKSSRNEVIGLVGDRVKVAVRAAPQNGEANKALEEVIASFFSLKKSSCTVTSGHQTSRKTVFISEDVESKIKAVFCSNMD